MNPGNNHEFIVVISGPGGSIAQHIVSIKQVKLNGEVATFDIGKSTFFIDIDKLKKSLEIGTPRIYYKYDDARPLTDANKIAVSAPHAMLETRTT